MKSNMSTKLNVLIPLILYKLDCLHVNAKNFILFYYV